MGRSDPARKAALAAVLPCLLAWGGRGATAELMGTYERASERAK